MRKTNATSYKYRYIFDHGSNFLDKHKLVSAQTLTSILMISSGRHTQNQDRRFKIYSQKHSYHIISASKLSHLHSRKKKNTDVNEMTPSPGEMNAVSLRSCQTTKSDSDNGDCNVQLTCIGKKRMHENSFSLHALFIHENMYTHANALMHLHLHFVGVHCLVIPRP